jgi:hypothetical protein
MFMLFATLATTIPPASAYDIGSRYASELYITNWRQWTNGSLGNGAATASTLSEIEWLFSLPIYYEWYEW